MRRRGFLQALVRAAAIVALAPQLAFRVKVEKLIVPTSPWSEYVVGYKGDTFLQTGRIYAPYIPLFQTKSLA